MKQKMMKQKMTNRMMKRRSEVRKDRKKMETDLRTAFNDITKETTQLIEIKDVKDEIVMLSTVLKAQLPVIQKFAITISRSRASHEYAGPLTKLLARVQEQKSGLTKMLRDSGEIFDAVKYPVCGF
jgi:hypothetical protein